MSSNSNNGVKCFHAPSINLPSVVEDFEPTLAMFVLESQLQILTDAEISAAHGLIMLLRNQDLHAIVRIHYILYSCIQYSYQTPHFVVHGKHYYIGDKIKTKANDNKYHITHITNIANDGKVTVKRSQTTSTVANHRSNKLYISRGKYMTRFKSL
eukprot:421597_1